MRRASFSSFVSFVSFVVLCVLVCPCAERAASQTSDLVGVRALGMAGAFTAVADDATATWWNPAGLAGGAYFSAIHRVRRTRRTGRGEGLRGCRSGFRPSASAITACRSAKYGRRPLQTRSAADKKPKDGVRSQCRTAPRSANPSESIWSSDRRVKLDRAPGRRRAGWTWVRWRCFGRARLGLMVAECHGTLNSGRGRRGLQAPAACPRRGGGDLGHARHHRGADRGGRRGSGRRRRPCWATTRRVAAGGEVWALRRRRRLARRRSARSTVGDAPRDRRAAGRARPCGRARIVDAVADRRRHG